MISDKVKELEKQVWDRLNEYFPKGGSQKEESLRAKALVLITLSKEMGVQGHADHIKSKLDASRDK